MDSIYKEKDGGTDDSICGKCSYYKDEMTDDWCRYVYKCTYSPIPWKSYFKKAELKEYKDAS